MKLYSMRGLPKGLSGKESVCQCRRRRRCRFSPHVRKISWLRKWQPTPIFLPGKSHGQRTLVDYSPWGRKELDTTKQLHLLSLISLDFVHLIVYFPEDTHISTLNSSKQLFEKYIRKKITMLLAFCLSQIEHAVN